MRLNNKSAFSTAEMLVTIMVFSLGILPLIVLFQNSHKHTAQAKNLIIAQSIGRSMIAEVRSLGFDLIYQDKLGLQHHDREVTGRLVPTDDNSIEYPEYYKRFKTTLKFEDSGDRTIDGVTKPPNKIRVELDIEWLEPNMRKINGHNFKLGFGTVIVKYDT